MITLGAKLYFGLTAAALAAAMLLGLASGGTPLGVATFAFAGSVGDPFGYTVLVGVAAITFFVGVVVVAFRDADAQAVVQVAGVDELPAELPPSQLSPWPFVAAFGVATLLVGLVVDGWLIGIALVLLAAAAVEWTVGAWADRATGDPGANRAIRNRVMAPIETPAASLFAVFIFVFFASRILLAVSKWGAVAVFGIAAIVILGMAALLASRPTINRSVVTAALLVGGLALVAGGVAGMVSGEREFHHLGDAGENGHGDESDEETGADSDPEADTTAGDTEE